MNLIEILKNCPRGMKLYSPICGEVELKEVSEYIGIIGCKSGNGSIYFYSDGTYLKGGECVLFPSKEQRDWDKFMIPFKDGDIIIRTEFNPGCKQYNIAIFDHYNNNPINKMSIHCQVNGTNEFKTRMCVCHKDWRLANAEEIQRFMTRMHESGYDFKDGKLTRLYKYGDIVAFHNETWGGYNIGIFDKYLNDTFCKVLCITLVSDGSTKIVDENYDIGRGWDTKKARHATLSEKLDLLEKLAKIGYKWNNDKLIPIAKFKVGDIITNGKLTFKIGHIDDEYYYEVGRTMSNRIFIAAQDKWKIKKFDIHSLKPYVIPYENNEHLVAKYDDPDPYYITWQE